jgi:hypothetical protein
MAFIDNLDIAGLQMISAPNSYNYIKNWTVQGSNGVRLWFRLTNAIATCPQPLFPPLASTVKVIFPRARTIALGQPQVSQTVELLATQDMLDKSLFYIDLTSTNAGLVTSGTVQFKFIDGLTEQLVVKNFFMKKISQSVGC